MRTEISVAFWQVAFVFSVVCAGVLFAIGVNLGRELEFRRLNEAWGQLRVVKEQTHGGDNAK
jgi:hypothetical protein